MTRAEHLLWAKARALGSVDADDTTGAFASMASDLKKHPETENHSRLMLGMSLLMAGMLSTKEQMRKFIEGFN